MYVQTMKRLIEWANQSVEYLAFVMLMGSNSHYFNSLPVQHGRCVAPPTANTANNNDKIRIQPIFRSQNAILSSSRIKLYSIGSAGVYVCVSVPASAFF